MSDILKYHRWCISDEVAMGAFREAVHRVVRPGDVVLDLGAGTGILSMQACAAGASRAYAVEMTGIAAVIADVASANGFAARIVPIHNSCYDVELPIKADVLIASMFGSAGIGNDLLRAVLDARTRLMRPDGRIIPHALTPVFCPVEIPTWYADHVESWEQRRCGFNFELIRRLAVNRVGSAVVTESQLLAEPRSLQEITLNEITSSNVGGEVCFEALRNGTFHAIAGWTDLTMTQNVRCSSSPVATKRMPWDHMVLPLETPIVTEQGDVIRTTIRSDFVSEDVILTWLVSVSSRSGGQKAECRQSTFLGHLISVNDLQIAKTRI